MSTLFRHGVETICRLNRRRCASIADAAVSYGCLSVTNTDRCHDTLMRFKMWFSTHCNVLAACKDARQMAPFTKYNALGRSELSTATSSFEVKRHGFKPRKKQLVTLTDKALNRLREICNDPTRIVKLMFVLKGCNGYSYEMEIVDRNSLDEMDEIIKDDAGNSVLAIENKTAFHMLGCHIDYAISPLEEGFVFDNPNVTSKCGCGQSFRF